MQISIYVAKARGDWQELDGISLADCMGPKSAVAYLYNAFTQTSYGLACR